MRDRRGDDDRFAPDDDSLAHDGGRIESDGGRVGSDGGRVAPDGGRLDRLGNEVKRTFDPEELRRRNLSAVAIDVLYLFTTAFLATLFVRNPWQALIAAAPLAALLYFAWRSTTAFLLAQLLVIALTVVATYAGLLPI